MVASVSWLHGDLCAMVAARTLLLRFAAFYPMTRALQLISQRPNSVSCMSAPSSGPRKKMFCRRGCPLCRRISLRTSLKFYKEKGGCSRGAWRASAEGARVSNFAFNYSSLSAGAIESGVISTLCQHLEKTGEVWGVCCFEHVIYGYVIYLFWTLTPSALRRTLRGSPKVFCMLLWTEITFTDRADTTKSKIPMETSLGWPDLHDSRLTITKQNAANSGKSSLRPCQGWMRPSVKDRGTETTRTLTRSPNDRKTISWN
jgi:hypothetical protein